MSENGSWRLVTSETDYATAHEGLRRYLLEEGIQVRLIGEYYHCVFFAKVGEPLVGSVEDAIMAVIERPVENEDNAS